MEDAAPMKEGKDLKEASLQNVCKLRLVLKSPIEERTMGNLMELQQLSQVPKTNLPSEQRSERGKMDRVYRKNFCEIKRIKTNLPTSADSIYL